MKEVNRREGEKPCGRNVQGEANPGEAGFHTVYALKGDKPREEHVPWWLMRLSPGILYGGDNLTKGLSLLGFTQRVGQQKNLRVHAMRRKERKGRSNRYAPIAEPVCSLNRHPTSKEFGPLL